MISHFYPWSGAADGVKVWQRLSGRPLPNVHGRALGEKVELFLSTFVNKVDRKGRVSVPATFRSTLATHRHPNQVVLIPSFKYPAIDGTGSDHLSEMMEGLNTLDQYSDRRDDLALAFADATPLQIDGE